MPFAETFLGRISELEQGFQINSFLIACVTAYCGGVLASLTPCVYPMIPMTLGVITSGIKPGEKVRFYSLFGRGLAYVLGMAVIYSLLGVFAALTGKVFGRLTQSVFWYFFLGSILTFSALWMLDALDPSPLFSRINLFIISKLDYKEFFQKKESSLSFFGAFGLGVSSGLIAAPCTTPVLSAILGYISKSGSYFLGFCLMNFFSLGLGTLLLVIAALAGLGIVEGHKFFPKSGAWMLTIKKIGGLILLGFADYLIFKAGQL